ncbi:hypothetical protein C8Q76DRAFT_413517 [Earliella scabrosa]|nr:hypothetical protein C8Q76DRAFT_413517 [Earliella scabrosa]
MEAPSPAQTASLSSPQSSFFFPAEIEYAVIDTFSESTRELDRLSLVCRRWAAVARSHLFRSIIIRGYRDLGPKLATNIVTFSLTRPDLTAHVRTLVLKTATYRDQRLQPRISLGQVQTLVIAMPNLRVFYLRFPIIPDSLVDPSPLPETPTSVLAQTWNTHAPLKVLDRLTLKCWSTHVDATYILAIARLFQKIGTLRLSGMECEGPDVFTLPDSCHSHSPMIRGLELSRITESFMAALSAMLHQPSAASTHLTEMLFKPGSIAQISLFSSFLRELGAYVRDLYLHVKYAHEVDLVAWFRALNLQPCAGLQHLSVEFEADGDSLLWLMDDTMRWAHEILPACTSLLSAHSALPLQSFLLTINPGVFAFDCFLFDPSPTSVEHWSNFEHILRGYRTLGRVDLDFFQGWWGLSQEDRKMLAALRNCAETNLPDCIPTAC